MCYFYTSTYSSLYVRNFTLVFFAAMDIQLFTAIESVREEQRHQNQMLSTILMKLGEGVVDEEMPDGIHFPLKTIEEMASFEEKLRNTNVEKLIVSDLEVIWFLYSLPDVQFLDYCTMFYLRQEWE